jgi:biopolymer transport protein ExbD
VTDKTLIVRKRRQRLEVNVVPLVDVLTVLLFFFLVTMQFRNMSTLNITAPDIETAGQNDFREQTVIAVDNENQIFLNNEPVSREELEQAVKILSSIDKSITVLLVADEDTALKNVTMVMDICRKNGLEKLRIQSR